MLILFHVMASTVLRPGGVMVARRVHPYLGFLVNTSDPLAAIMVMELRNGLNCPNDRPLIGYEVPGCHMMLII